MVAISDLMEYIISNRAPELRKDVLADFFCRMMWIVADNGAGISAVRRTWLQGDDPLRVEIALLMDETFPFDDRADMAVNFSRIGCKWPEFQTLCNNILAQWDSQFPPEQ